MSFPAVRTPAAIGSGTCARTTRATAAPSRVGKSLAIRGPDTAISIARPLSLSDHSASAPLDRRNLKHACWRKSSGRSGRPARARYTGLPTMMKRNGFVSRTAIMVWVHWVVYNIPPDTKSLPENAGKARLPQGVLLGLNDFKKTGYGGPCPPIGRHRYFHKLYALDITLDLKGATKSQIERAMRGHVLANAELIGTFQKGDR